MFLIFPGHKNDWRASLFGSVSCGVQLITVRLLMPQGRLVNTISPEGNQISGREDLVVPPPPPPPGSTRFLSCGWNLVVDDQSAGVMKRAAGHPFGAPGYQRHGTRRGTIDGRRVWFRPRLFRATSTCPRLTLFVAMSAVERVLLGRNCSKVNSVCSPPSCHVRLRCRPRHVHPRSGQAPGGRCGQDASPRAGVAQRSPKDFQRRSHAFDIGGPQPA